MNDSDSDAAVQGGSPEVVVVPEVVEVVEVVAGAVVVVVGSVVAVAVLTDGEPVAAAPVEAAGVPPELPQAASAVAPIAAAHEQQRASDSCGVVRALRYQVLPGWVGHPFLRTPSACQYPGRRHGP